MNHRRGWRPWILLAAALCALLAGARSIGPARDIPAATGYAAWDLCTRVMQIGQPLERVRRLYTEPKVRQLPYLWAVDFQPGSRVEVRTMLPTLTHARSAIFRPHLGCTLIPPDASEAEVRAQPFRPAPEPPADARPWPLGEGPAETGLLGKRARAIVERHARIIFGEPSDELDERLNATALLVAREGHLVYERYGPGMTREQPQLGWSMTKTLTAIIAGAMQRQGRIDLDRPVGLPRWKGTAKQEITWRQLLNMAPGLAWFEGYGGKSDATDMLFSQADQGAWAADRPLVAKPGTVFNYSTGFSNIAMLRMRQLLGGGYQAIYDYYQRRIFAPLGIRRGVIEPDASGTPVGGARGILRPVDWLRLGQLVADGGTWDAEAILSPGYVAFLTAASPASPGYGGSIWRQASDKIAPETRARLPQDTVWFAGHMGQFTIVVPSRKLVLLRMGVAQGQTMYDNLPLRQVLALAVDLLRS